MNRQSARLGILIQARMSSRRLPGKVLKPLVGRPVIQHVWERCRRVSGADLVAIITSDDASDDPLADWARAQGAGVFRGPLDDVAARFVAAADAFDLDAFVRVNADSPLLDPRLVGHGVSLYRESEVDLVTNVLCRTYPAGMSVEVLDRRRFAHAYEDMESPEDREHVTRYYYRHPEKFKIDAFESDRDFGDRDLAIDTADDFARIDQIMAAMDEQDADDDCASICEVAEGCDLLSKRGGAK